MLLEIEGVTKAYELPDGAGRLDVLRGVSLCIEEGDTLSIVGPSGSGKSTLLNLMGGLDRPSAGTIRFKGQNLAGMTDKGLARLRNLDIGFVFQLHHLLPQCTVLENVLVPTLASASRRASGGSRERAMHLLERVGLADRAGFFPSRLSGGERQRAAVARALINRPSLLLADEPTGSLDRGTAAATGSLLVELNREEKAALVVVTHSDELAGLMRRQFRLVDGKLGSRNSEHGTRNSE